MNHARRLTWTCLGLGILILYMTWGGAIDLFLAVLSVKGRVPANPQGLHIGAYGMIDFVDERNNYLYDNAGVTLLFQSFVGLTMVETGLRLRLSSSR